MEEVSVKVEPQEIQVKIEPQDIKTEPDAESSLPKKKKSAGRPKKLKQEKITDHVTVVKKKRDRFKGMSEEEVAARLLPDHLAPNLDIVIIGINPGLFAAFIGHHYAGPGNHFWKCMYLSGLIPEPMNAMQDFKLLDYGIGFTNIVARTTKGSADLTRKEIKEGAVILTEKLQKYKPKIAVFNGKGIYEVFVGHKNFYFGKQPELLPGTETAVFVMPSSSARCSQLPRAVDKVPFYEALKKFRDHLNGNLPNLDDSEVCFPDLELKTAKKEPKTEGYDEEFNAREMEAQINQAADSLLSQFTQGNYQVIPHSSAEDFPNLPNLNGVFVPKIKQEPKDYESESTPQNVDSESLISDKSKAAKMTKKRNRSSQKKLVPHSESSSNLSTTLDSQNSFSSASSFSLDSNDKSGSQPVTQSYIISQVNNKCFDSDKQNMLTQSLSEYSSQSSSLQIKQEPQDPDYPTMPAFQQLARVKQEPEESDESSCILRQSHVSSYSQYLNLSQSDDLSQNGNCESNQSNSFLHGLYGMVNKVANHEHSHYGMVRLTNQNSFGSHPLQFNEALCGIVRDCSDDTENSSGPVIKTEPDIHLGKKDKPKTRKRKSDPMPVSTVTCSEERDHSSSSPRLSSSQNMQPDTAGGTFSQQKPHSVTPPNSFGRYPQEHLQNTPANTSHNSDNVYSQHFHPPHTSPVTDYQHYVNGGHANQIHHSSHFSQPFPSFSQMMAQDFGSFRMNPYGNDLSQMHVPSSLSCTNPGFPGYSYAYSYGQEIWGQPSNYPKENLRRMSADAVSVSKESAANRRMSSPEVSHNESVTLKQAADRPGQLESEGRLDQETGGKLKRSDL